MRYLLLNYFFCLNRLLSAILCIGMTLSLLSCSMDSDRSTNTTLKLWMHNGAEIEILPLLIAQFEADHPDIEVQIIKPPEYDYFKFLVASSRTGSLPDVFDVDAPNVAYMVNIGALMPFREVEGISDQQLSVLTDSFYPSIVDQGTVDGRLYTLGSYNSTVAVYYNAALITDALLAQAGVSHIPVCPKEAWTWSEFESVLAAFAVTYPDKYGIQMDFDIASPGADELLTFFYLPVVNSNDQEVIDPVTFKMTGYLNAPGAIEALERFNEFIHKDSNKVLIEDSSISGPAEAYFTEFKSGNAGFCWHGHWQYNGFKGEQNGQSWINGIGEDLKIMPPPRFSGKSLATATGSYSWGISSRTLHSREAFLLVEFLTSKAAQKGFIEGMDGKSGSGAIPTKEAARQMISPYAACEVMDCDTLCPASLNDDRCLFPNLLKCTAKVRPQTPAYDTFTAGFANVIRQLAENPSVDITSLLNALASEHDTELARILE